MKPNTKPTTNNADHWHSDLSLLLIVVFGWVVFTALGDYRELLSDRAYLTSTLAIFLLFAVSNVGTYVSARGNSLYDVGRYVPFKQNSVRIDQITKIARVQAFAVAHWGSLLAIYTADGSQKQSLSITIRENNYSADALKGILTYILEKNPAAELDPQYRDLLNGNIEDEYWFTRSPATHSSYDSVL